MSNEERIDYCVLCDGVQGPDHVHLCANCGEEIPLDQILSFGNDVETRRFYCMIYCHIIA